MNDADHISYGRSDENGTILQIGQEVSSRIGIWQFRARRVQWVQKYGKGKYVLPDLPAFHQDALLLSDMLEGKLAPEDWRALLCSSVIYDEKLRLKRRFGRAATLSGFVLVFLAAYLLSSILLSIWFPRGLPSYLNRRFGTPFDRYADWRPLVGRRNHVTLYETFDIHRRSDDVSGIWPRRPASNLSEENRVPRTRTVPFRRGRFAHVPSMADRIQKLLKESDA